jgi:F-type H+-transporting ATPase subunit b
MPGTRDSQSDRPIPSLHNQMTFALGFAENSIQLVPDGTLILHVIIILVMVYVLNATLFKPINRILEARDRRTRGRLSESEGILKDVSEKLSHYEKELRRARAESYALAESERAAALQQRQKQVTEMRRQLAESVSQEKEAIRGQADEARASLEHDSKQIAREIGSRILNRPLKVEIGELM